MEGTSAAVQDLEEYRDEEIALAHGIEEQDKQHDLAWMMKAISYFQELNKEVVGDTIDNVRLRCQVLGVAAILICWAESIDRRGSNVSV